MNKFLIQWRKFESKSNYIFRDIDFGFFWIFQKFILIFQEFFLFLISLKKAKGDNLSCGTRADAT